MSCGVNTFDTDKGIYPRVFVPVWEFARRASLISTHSRLTYNWIFLRCQPIAIGMKYGSLPFFSI